MFEKPVAIVLGGIIPHGEVIKKLKARGYYTVLVDYSDNPPAASIADVHSKESAMDYEAVLKLAETYEAKIVMSPCLDQQMVIAMKVCEALGLFHPISSETALNVTNKKNMKRIMMEKGIKTARYYHVANMSELNNIELEYPIIIKPVDGCGSAGVEKVYTEKDMRAAVGRALDFSRSSAAIVEEFQEGNEISAYTYICNGKAHLLTVSQRVSDFSDNRTICYGVINPPVISETLRKNLILTAEKIADVFCLDNTPLFYQSMVKNDEVSIIEFSPRMGGGIGYRVIQISSEIDVLELAISSYLGEEPEINITPTGTHMHIQQLFCKDGIFSRVEGTEMIESIGAELLMLKCQGAHIDSSKPSNSKVASLIIKGSSDSECEEKLKRIWPAIKILDSNENDMLNRKLSLVNLYY